MTDMEALLSVDAGKTPPGVVAFFMGDAERDLRRVCLVIATIAALSAGAAAWSGAGLLPITVLILVTGLFGVLATPTIRMDGQQRIKRQVMVVTTDGLIVRDGCGLHSWRLDDLADVVPGTFDCRTYLDIIERNGNRHTIETIGFRRGDRIRRVITTRLRLRQTPVA